MKGGWGGGTKVEQWEEEVVRGVMSVVGRDYIKLKPLQKKLIKSQIISFRLLILLWRWSFCLWHTANAIATGCDPSGLGFMPPQL